MRLHPMILSSFCNNHWSCALGACGTHIIGIEFTHFEELYEKHKKTRSGLQPHSATVHRSSRHMTVQSHKVANQLDTPELWLCTRRHDIYCHLAITMRCWWW